MAKKEIDIVSSNGQVFHGEVKSTSTRNPDAAVYKGVVGSLFGAIDSVGDSLLGVKDSYATIKTPDGETRSGKIKK